MSKERSSLEVEAGFNQLELRIEQRPLVGWAVLAHVSTFLFVFAAIPLGLLGFAMLWGLAAAALFVVGLMWKRPVRFRLGPNVLIVDGWTGLLARPRLLRLPLEGLRIEHRTSGSVNNRRVHRLILQSPEGGRGIRLGGLACSTGDLDRLVAEVADAQDAARSRIGAGEQEVPAVLHAVRAEHREPGD